MDKKPLIAVSICAVVLLVLGSLSIVVGYQSIDSTSPSDSPLFCVKIQRFMRTQQNTFISQYLGEGKNSENDTTPPVTTCILDPSDPDGENGWYVSILTVTLNATDDDSGVNSTLYKLDGGVWQIYLESFPVTLDGQHTIQYYSVDNAGNTEPQKNVTFAMDRTKPMLEFTYSIEGGLLCGYVITFYAVASDVMSGMNRAEFYFNNVLQKTIVGPGPEYAWDYPCWYKVRGFIRNPEITEDYVKFYAVLVRISGTPSLIPHITQSAIAYDNAGNWEKCTLETPTYRMPIIKPDFYLLRDVTLPSNYTGVIGDYFVWANFLNN
jgi:hypothetical protein